MATDKKTADSHLINPIGGISQSIIKSTDNVAFITLYRNRAKRGKNIPLDNNAKWPTVHLAMAPVTGVEIQQLTDYSVTKSLDTDFLVATFGDNPVQITLRGVNFFNVSGCGEQQYISDFYDSNKLSTNKNARFDVAIASNKTNTVAFRCVLVGMTMSHDTTVHAGQIMYNYTLSFIGVRKNKK